MVSPDNDFSKFEHSNLYIIYHIIIAGDIGVRYVIVIVYASKVGFYYSIVIAYDNNNAIILDVIDDNCSK